MKSRRVFVEEVIDLSRGTRRGLEKEARRLRRNPGRRHGGASMNPVGGSPACGHAGMLGLLMP